MSNPILPTTAGGNTNQSASFPQAQPYPSIDLVQKVAIHAERANLGKYLPPLLKAMASAGLTSKYQLIAIIATVSVEVPPFAPIREYGGPSKRYAPHFGRGLIQLTWYDNYKKAETDLNIPGLADNPDLALEPENSTRILVWFWTGRSGNNPSKFAESGDWRGVRRAVNGGYNGWDHFKDAVDRGLQHFNQDLDPNAVGAYPSSTGYGLGCVDGGYGHSRTLSGGSINPTTQGDALIYALGLHLRDRANSVEARLRINAAAALEILELDAQKKFQLTGIEDGTLDGEFNTEEVIFYPLSPNGIEVDVIGRRPDPNAPPPDIFLHNPQQGMVPPDISKGGAAVPAGEIPQRLYQSALAAEGKNSAAGPYKGRKACAWAVNLFVVLPAGLQNIGQYKDSNYNNVTVGVVEMVKDLEGGRGVRVSRGQSVKGDIWVSPRQAHVGIVMEDGGGVVLSNSSSTPGFVWRDSIDDVNAYYGSSPEYGIFRLIS